MESVTKPTIVIELKGINMAAMMGESRPVIANDKPIMLYVSEITKLLLTTLKLECVKWIKSER